ncbi:hypothetical protein TNCV_5041161 [Trichonephila clavipes]|nr:hypothetical protein TNCV_5041161 [Trichonephila clavipes]
MSSTPAPLKIRRQKDYEERSSLEAQLSVISEERVERETEEKIARQHAIQQLRWESEVNELRLEIESIRLNVKRTGLCRRS